MELPQSAVDDLLRDAAQRWVAEYEQGMLSQSDPAFWAARAVQSFCKNGSMDRGLFSIFLFNLVKLEKGQGIFQGAGIPHAYLEGQNVEIMANSDNVLRGGLTSKHLDVSELMRHICTDPIEPIVLEPSAEQAGLCDYPAPVNDFKIRSISLMEGQEFSYRSPEPLILLAPSGDLQITHEADRMHLGTPDLCTYVTANTAFTIHAQSESMLFIASGQNRGLN